MRLQQASSLVMSLKGAGLACLVLMWAMRKSKRNWSRNDLSTYSGYSRETVAQGLERLQLYGLVSRLNVETWQLTNVGFQLGFDDLFSAGQPAENMDSRTTSESKISTLNSSSFKDSLSMHDDSVNKQLPLLRVENFDSHVVRDSIFDHLKNLLISAGTPPAKAQESIIAALERQPDHRTVELDILIWQAYCATKPKIEFAGNLISARIREGIPPPADFRLRDMPAHMDDLRQQIEDLQQEIENQHETT